VVWDGFRHDARGADGAGWSPSADLQHSPQRKRRCGFNLRHDNPWRGSAGRLRGADHEPLALNRSGGCAVGEMTSLHELSEMQRLHDGGAALYAPEPSALRQGP
jgi:hypothetical protein